MSKAAYKRHIDGLRRAQKARANSRYYKLNSILGNDWAIFYGIIGGRKTGKSYSVTDFLCGRKKKLGDMCKNYWMRISETSTKALLANKADKLVDPDLYRKYDLDLTTKAMDVFNRGEHFMTVVPLSQFGKLKGVGFYDKDFRGEYNIVLDEFQLEIGEKRTSFDILYNFLGMIENIARTTKGKIRVFLLGNTLEEASTILKAFNFLPEKFGRFYLVKNKQKLYDYLKLYKTDPELADKKYKHVDFGKRCVIDNLEPTEDYLTDRKGSIADILGGNSMSNYTNELTKDRSMVTKERLRKPTAIIKFTKDCNNWYTVWDGHIIARYNREQLPEEYIYCMRPYLGNYYSRERRIDIIDRFDAKIFKFKNLIVHSYFQEEMKQIRLT